MSRIELITQAGYQVKIMWEYEFDSSKIVEQKPELLTHPIVRNNPLNTRDALCGGRIEAMRLHYKLAENESIQYCDVMSLSPYICKYYKFPIGHSVIYVGDTCKNIEACLQMEGLIKCTVVPPNDLYHPVLPFRCNKKLLFCLCNTCVLDPNTRGECHHFADAERAISGTWVTDKIRTVVQKGYKILEIHEVYEYKVKRYNRETREGGLFVDYINTFLKLKAEATGYPSWVQTPTDEDRYIEEFRQSEGILLDKDSIRHNSSKRELAKLCLNSMWGKLGENSKKTLTKLISDPQELYRFLVTPGIEVANLLFAGDAVFWVTLRHAME